MKTLYALYDENDRFIDCAFNLREMEIKPTNISWLKRGKKRKLVEIPLSITNDIFAQEDQDFLEFLGENAFSNKELAERQGVSIRTIFRQKQKLRLKGE